jgi:hypothetical protein
VTALDHQRGSVRWQRDLAAAVLETRVVLAADRVVLTTYAGDLFVLDRDDGRVVARLGTGRLGGLPVSTAAAPGPNRRRILVALRLRDWGIQLRRLP